MVPGVCFDPSSSARGRVAGAAEAAEAVLVEAQGLGPGHGWHDKITVIGGGFTGVLLPVVGSFGHDAVGGVLPFRYNRSPMPQTLHPLLRKDLFDRGTP